MSTKHLSRIDPQRLTLLRRQFLGDCRARFKRLQSSVWDLIVNQDVFGLRTATPLTLNTRWNFLPLDQQAEQFNEWLKEELQRTLLEKNGVGEPWIKKYVTTAYQRGILRSYNDLHLLQSTKNPQWHMMQEQQFLRATLNANKFRGKQQLVVTRAFGQLKGITDTIRKNASRIITVGLSSRVQPRVLATELSNEIRGVKNKPVLNILTVNKKKKGHDARSSAIVNTELSYAHSEGQLDALDQMGLEDVEILAEWVTAENPCPECEEFEGTVWRLEDAYGVLPLHPHCRCSWMALDAEDLTDITSEWFT